MKLRDVFTDSPRKPFICTDLSLTDQSEAAACDLSAIIDWHNRTGSWVMPGQRARQQSPAFDDVSAYANVDYQEAYNLVVDAHDKFMSLPAKVRERFANDPAEMFGFLQDVNNRAEAIELGLIPAPVETPPPGSVTE